MVSPATPCPAPIDVVPRCRLLPRCGRTWRSPQGPRHRLGGVRNRGLKVSSRSRQSARRTAATRYTSQPSARFALHESRGQRVPSSSNPSRSSSSDRRRWLFALAVTMSLPAARRLLVTMIDVEVENIGCNARGARRASSPSCSGSVAPSREALVPRRLSPRARTRALTCGNVRCLYVPVLIAQNILLYRTIFVERQAIDAGGCVTNGFQDVAHLEVVARSAGRRRCRGGEWPPGPDANQRPLAKGRSRKPSAVDL